MTYSEEYKSGDVKVTISRVHGGRNTESPVRINIKDALSATNIIEVSMTLENFAEALMGLGGVLGTDTKYPRAKDIDHLGMKLIVRDILIPKSYVEPDGYSTTKEVKLKMIKKYLFSYDVLDPGEIIWGDGIGSQQSVNDHRITIARWESKEDKDE